MTLPPGPAPLHYWAAAAKAAAGGLQPEAPENAGAGEGTQAVPSGSCSGHRYRAAPGVLLMSPGRRAAEGLGGVCAETRLPTHRLPGRCPRRFTGAVEEAQEDGERRACACRMCCLTLHGYACAPPGAITSSLLSLTLTAPNTRAAGLAPPTAHALHARASRGRASAQRSTASDSLAGWREPRDSQSLAASGAHLSYCKRELAKLLMISSVGNFHSQTEKL